jgi:hypothetical protein
MGQQPSIPITSLQNPLILTFSEELFTLIALFMDTESQLALAHTCRIAYAYHEKQYREETVAFLCELPSNAHCISPFERWLSETGWATVKIVLKGISTVSQEKDGHPIRALCLEESVQVPNELKCESINALVVESPSKTSFTSLSISFLKKFPNLKILRLVGIIINKNIVSVISKISLLKVISLNHCAIPSYHLSKIFETCTTLEEIELIYNHGVTSIMFPSQVKRLHIMDFRSMQIDLSRCTQLQSL